ncbi:MAG: hypothetical protein DUD35_07985 [Lactobacillus sp.]|nr:MAG: hypothetical protein DUD35_07985 [Lactobacillus sp.]
MKGHISTIIESSLLMMIFLLGFSFCKTTASYAQSYYQSIPTSYRGTWHEIGERTLTGHWYRETKEKLIVHRRFVKTSVGTFGGLHLGVHRGKHYVTILPIRSGHRAGENYVMRRGKYYGHKAILVDFDICEQLYIK